MACLAFLGLAVVPLGAFSALRNERMEQTFELITLTALSSRRVVIGKLMAQGVKLATLFAAMAPFIAMSFLLGGIDFVTILISLVVPVHVVAVGHAPVVRVPVGACSNRAPCPAWSSCGVGHRADALRVGGPAVLSS